MEKPFVISIDPPYSRDLDDAVCAERIEGGWRVDVCVPDVSSVVQPSSPVDAAARAMVATRYGGSYIREPMLPDEVVTTLSLSPHRRTAMCWFRLTLNDDLGVVDVSIRTIRHRTAHRMSYLEADGALADAAHPLHGRISDMWDLAMALHVRRRLRTGAAFDPEQHLYTTEEGLVAQLSAKESHRTHLLVMEMMILVNEALAVHARDAGIPVIYRNHKPRDSSSGLREEVVREMRAVEGLGSEEAAERMRHIAARIGPATFGTRPEGHWGLDVPAYAWFTSPLRRYCDIVNLRSLVHGVADPDAVETARHIDEGVREARESTAQHHGLRSRARIVRSIRSNDAEGLVEWDLHTILRACAENDVINPMVDAEVVRRTDANRLTGKDIESVFTHGRETLASETAEHVTAWLFADAQRQIVLARDMVMRQRTVAVPMLAGGSPDTRAAIIEIASLLGIALPEGYASDEAEAGGKRYDIQGDAVIDHPNPKGALLELATARRATVEFVDAGRVGPPHDPRFTVEAVWTLEGRSERSSASASSVKAASKAAAWELLSRIDGEPTPERAVSTTSHDGKPPKNILLEHAARHRGELSYSPARMTGPPHQPSFAVEATYRVAGRVLKGRGEGAIRKEAERLASVEIIAQL